LVGRDVTVAGLLGYHDLLFVGVGLGSTGRLGIPGQELAVEALALIARLKAAPAAAERLDGKRVLIVGGGNTAIDAATQASRRGEAGGDGVNGGAEAVSAVAEGRAAARARHEQRSTLSPQASTAQ